MRPGKGFEVTPEHLVQHATHLDRVSIDVTTAANAADAVRLDDQAYGQLLTGVLPPLMAFIDETVGSGIRAAAGSLGTTAQDMRVTANTYTSTDAENASAYFKLRDDLR